ncbi:unnamed protein product [Blepharisma stoltei]|uniref:ATP-grasp domain-containing protein n=1 Tax=Blepharisma stoltei TaxID=1481888 RepID=A0AAU9J4S9_9CILI|nr:unnamed protein product [Blepharisma stoltei]
MSNQDLNEQYKEMLGNIALSGKVFLKVLGNAARLTFNTAVFLLSCGSLVRWKQPQARNPPEKAPIQKNKSKSPQVNPDSTDSSGNSAVDDTEDALRYQVRQELQTSIPRTASRDMLNRLIQSHEFSQRESWVDNRQQEEDIIVIPSLSIDQGELQKITAVGCYEERQLCTLFYLKNPRCRLVYVTSMPVDKAIVDYYLNLLEENSIVTANQASKRLLLLSCNDSSPIPLTSKILRRPKLIQKIKNFINPIKSHMICFISSNLERDLALQLSVPLFANDPSLTYWGTKIGSRKAFEKAGIKLPRGTQLVHSAENLANEIAKLYKERNFEVQKFVVKLNIGFSGEGNAIIRSKFFDKNDLETSILEALCTHLEYVYKKETWQTFVQKIIRLGVLAEEWIENAVESPSCQALINPKGKIEVLSTHEQLLADGLTYMGCVFPASEEYRKIIMENTLKIGQVLAKKGCKERFAVDYVVRQEEGVWAAYAIEINLRWGGTSHPMITAKNLTDAQLTEDGILLGADDQAKFYIATDTVQNDVYTGLTPADFLDFVNSNKELQFDNENAAGVVFHLLSAISVYGKFGFTAIGNSAEEAKAIFDRALQVLEREANQISSQKKFTELDQVIQTPDD